MDILAAIFDLDGTITRHYFDFDAMRLEMGLSPDAGPIWEAMMKMPCERRQEAMRILDSHEEKAVDASSLNPGAKELISELAGRGIKTGIITRNTKANTLAVAARHGLAFDEIYGRGEGPIKPDAFGVLELCRRFRVCPAQTLVVGDYLFDLTCARSAGTIPVWLRNEHHGHDFSDDADYTIDALGELIDIIDNNI